MPISHGRQTGTVTKREDLTVVGIQKGVLCGGEFGGTLPEAILAKSDQVGMAKGMTVRFKLTVGVLRVERFRPGLKLSPGGPRGIERWEIVWGSPGIESFEYTLIT